MLRSGAAYTIASAIPRAVGFLLLPVFTRILSPADYGQLSVALSVNAVASIVFALGFEIAVFRGLYRLENDPRGRVQFLRTTWTFLIYAPLLMATVCTAVLAPVLGSSDVLSATRLTLSLFGAAIFVAATTVPLVLFRAENRVRDYMSLNLAVAATTTALTLALVVGFRIGVEGWLLAVIVGNAVGLAFAVRRIPYARPRPFDWETITRTLRLSLPVVPHFAALWTLQLADRVLVATLLSLTAAGVYSLGSNLALPVYMIVIGFGQAFMPDYAQATRSGGGIGLRRTISLQVGVVAALTAVCALLAPLAVRFLDTSYASAAALVPWLVLGYAFLGLYAIPMNGVTLTHGRTRGLILVSGTGAATNIGMIIALGPRYGVEAVAIASAVGYAVLLAAVLVFAKAQDAALEYPWKRICAALLIGLVGYACGAVSTQGATFLFALVGRAAWSVITVAAIAAASLGPRSIAHSPLGTLRAAWDRRVA
jgi:O-antigen/teichoic acid export membrane protein